MEVIVTRRYKGKQKDVGYNFAYGTGSANASLPPNAPPGNAIIPYPEPAVFNFENTDNPIIEDFDILYMPIYGRHPRFTLIIYEDSLPEQESGFVSESELIQYMPPKVNITDGVILSVEYDLAGLGLVSGKIIINK